MKQIVRPSFLVKLDRHLRANHPVVWRTRVHWMLYYSVALAMPLLYALSWLVPVRITYLPDFDSLHTIGGLIDMMAWMVLGYWLYTQVRIKLADRSMKALGLTAVLSGVICAVIWSTSLVFNVSVFYRIKQLRSEQEVQHDLALVRPFDENWHQNFDYGLYQTQMEEAYDYRPLTPVSLSKERADQIAEVASTYGLVDPQLEIFTEDGKVFGVKQDDRWPIWEGGEAIAINVWVDKGTVPNKMNGSYYGIDLDKGKNRELANSTFKYRLDKLSEVHAFWRGKGEFYLRYIRPLDRRFRYFGMLWLLVTILGLSKRTLGPEAWNLKRWLPTGSLPALPRWEWLQRLEGSLVVRQPDRWGMRMYAVWGGILSLIGVGWIMTWLLTQREGVDLLVSQYWLNQDWIVALLSVSILLVVIGVLRMYFLRANPFGISPRKQLGYLVSMGLAFSMFAIWIAGFFAIDQRNLAAVRSDKEFAEDKALFQDHLYLVHQQERRHIGEGEDGFSVHQEFYIWPKRGELDVKAWERLAEEYGFDEVTLTRVPWEDMPTKLRQGVDRLGEESLLEFGIQVIGDSIYSEKVRLQQFQPEHGRWWSEAYPLVGSLPVDQLYQLHLTYRDDGQLIEGGLPSLRQIVTDIRYGKKNYQEGLEVFKSLDIVILELLGGFVGIWALIMQFLMVCWAIKFTSLRETFLAVLGIFVLGFFTVLMGLGIRSSEFFVYFMGPVWFFTFLGTSFHYAREEILQTTFNRTFLLIMFMLTPLTSMMVLGYLLAGYKEVSMTEHLISTLVEEEIIILILGLMALAFYLIITRVQLKGLQRMWYAPKMK